MRTAKGKNDTFAGAALPSVPGLWIDEEEKALVEFIMLSTDGNDWPECLILRYFGTLLPILSHRDVEFHSEQVS